MNCFGIAGTGVLRVSGEVTLLWDYSCNGLGPVKRKHRSVAET